MPDWLTHIVIAAVVGELFSVRKKSLLFFGALLPDILPKLVLLRLFIPLPALDYTLLSAFHTPFVLFLVTLLIAPLFRYRYKIVVALITLGALTHFVSDALLQHFSGGVALLYPLSLKHYTLNLVWPEQSYLILLPALFMYGLILIVKRENREAKNYGTRRTAKAD
ncbi:MAG: hypothetical protein Q8R37_03600 [Nanoarchaeota archaeon]|nr:hypothetical protein [Nanoarchaeota archaeon]